MEIVLIKYKLNPNALGPSGLQLAAGSSNPGKSTDVQGSALGEVAPADSASTLGVRQGGEEAPGGTTRPLDSVAAKTTPPAPLENEHLGEKSAPPVGEPANDGDGSSEKGNENVVAATQPGTLPAASSKPVEDCPEANLKTAPRTYPIGQVGSAHHITFQNGSI